MLLLIAININFITLAMSSTVLQNSKKIHIHIKYHVLLKLEENKFKLFIFKYAL